MDKKPVFQPRKWSSRNIMASHNCYSYALDIIDSNFADLCKKHNSGKFVSDWCRKVKAQPGMYAGILKQTKNANIEKRMLKDNPFIKKTTFKKIEPNGYYKIALFVNSKNVSRYHFYRQDESGLWSHKSGWIKPSNKDASNKVILDPRKSNREEYNLFIGFYTVPIDKKIKHVANFFTAKKQ